MVTKGRLTRQELTWLLTQEAQGAAERLRRGVQVLTKTIPPPAGVGVTGVDDTLHTLEDAMSVLSSLHPKPVGGRGRRGRIDLAALLWEIAPDARVSIEPGSGTEVYGDESELRRMLHVLAGPGSRAGSAITVRRDGDEVRLQVALGPDSSVTSETERAWLSRMAIRYGGRFELESGAEVLSLPAEESEREERESLRTELETARRQGEAYARELAAVVSHGDEVLTQSTAPPPALPAQERLAGLARIAGDVAAELRAMLSPVGWDLLALLDERDASTSDSTSARLGAIHRRLALVQDFVGELGGIGELDPNEGHVDIDLANAVKTAIRGASPRADRQGVELCVNPQSEPGAAITVRAGARAVNLILRQLVSHAIAATPRGRRVVVSFGPSEVAAPPPTTGGSSQPPQPTGGWVIVDDSGNAIPIAARRSLVDLEVDAGTFGRPSSLSFHICSAVTEAHGWKFQLETSPEGGARAIVRFGR